MSAIDLLSPDIVRIIRAKGWKQLTPIQEQAVERILNTENNYILSAMTASGKTEAAFFPVLTKVDFEQPGVKVLYISPLKALINDQMDRIEELCESLDILVTKWHGDAKQGPKDKLLRDPKGIVLMTPESLEAMFQCHPENVVRLFSSLEFVIIDEIHYYLGTDRGTHLRSLLHRLQQSSEKTFRFIGLSATIGGDLAVVKNFMGCPETTKVLVDPNPRPMAVDFEYYGGDNEEPEPGQEGQEGEDSGESDEEWDEELNSSMKQVENLEQAEEDESPENDGTWDGDEGEDEGGEEVPDGEDGGEGPDGQEGDEGPFEGRGAEDDDAMWEEMMNSIAERVSGKKSLVFPNSRSLVEKVCSSLQDRISTPVFTHHANVSAKEREAVEREAKENSENLTICCTSTLELGIDIGNVDQILQVGPPPGSSSLAQRAGRSGRRSGRAVIIFYNQDPWDLVRTAATFNLCHMGTIEAPDTQILWYNAVLFQIMSVVREKKKIDIDDLIACIVENPALSFASAEEVRSIITHLSEEDGKYLEIKDGQRDEQNNWISGTVILGDNWRMILSKIEGYTIFSTPRNYRVMADDKFIGELEPNQQVKVGACFLLSGKKWQIFGIDGEKYVLHVRPAARGKKPRFTSQKPKVSKEVEQEMKRMLFSDENYEWLDERSAAALEELRNEFRDPSFQKMGSEDVPYQIDRANQINLYPFSGTKIFNTLILLFDANHDDYAVMINRTLSEFLSACREMIANPPDILNIIMEQMSSEPKDYSLIPEKFEERLPIELQAKMEASKNYDLEGTMEFLQHLVE